MLDDRHARNLACPEGMIQTSFDTPTPSSHLPQELNLTTHRAAGAGVWDRRGWDGTGEPPVARWLIGIGGGALAVEGLRRRGFSGSILAGLGGSLFCWALSGRGDLPTARQRLFDRLEQARAPWRSADPVHEASADSFPASDAPSFTPIVGPALRDAAAARFE
jgi:hypothetical protein